MIRRLVIVGASLAGLRAAEAARAAGFDGSLVVVGDEPHAPYTRPPLSKDLLAGTQTPEQCRLPVDGIEVDWRLGTAAVRLDRNARRVELADGAVLDYDRVIVATGCRARPWPQAGGDLAGVHTLRGLDDALALRQALADGPSRLVIIGAGFVGCEVAATARRLGLPVTVVDVAPHPLLPLGRELGAHCAAVHREHGVDLRCATGVTALHGGPRIAAVELTDGSLVGADTVLIALGAVANTDWLYTAGLSLNHGVVCDDTLTSVDDPDVLAAGDVCSCPHPLTEGAPARVEHWTVAADQGTLAGANAVLAPAARTAYTALPSFWSDQYDMKIRAVGFPSSADRLEVLEASADGCRLVAAGSSDSRFVGAVAINATKRLLWYRQRLGERPTMKELTAMIATDDAALAVRTAV